MYLLSIYRFLTIELIFTLVAKVYSLRKGLSSAANESSMVNDPHQSSIVIDRM